jgi:hypothetical protein
MQLEWEAIMWQANDMTNFDINDDNDNSFQFNSMIYYLCAESTATKPITDTAQCTL